MICCKLTFGITPQIPDKLLYEGREYEWKGYSPAIEYFKNNNLNPPKEALETTANYGYFIFTYSILESELFLVDVKILVRDKIEIFDFKSVFSIFFPKRDKIPMNFYSSIQVIPYGKLISKTRNEWSDTYYKKYLIIDFNNGEVESEYDINYKKFKLLKKELFKKFKNTSTYIDTKKSYVKELFYYNEYRSSKLTMDEYLELIIFKLVSEINF